MALGTPVAAAAAYSAASGTSVAPAYPTGILATDVVVLVVGQKPTTANGGTVTTPTGWTLRDSLTGAGGYGAVAPAADTGNTNLFIYTWNTPVANQTGNLTVTIGNNNVTWAFIVRIPTAGGTISYGTADGQRTTTPTSPMSIALTDGATATAFAAGDLALWAMCIPTDITTPAQFSAEAITATGATFGTAVEINEPDSTTGNDIGGYSAYASVTAGSSSTAPTVTVTVGGTLTNVRGPVVLLRVRETLPTRTGTLAATESGSDTFAATGDVHVKGSLAASETGADNFASTGTVTNGAISGTLAVSETGADTFTGAGDVIVKGALAVSETGSDTLAATGKVLVRGALAVSETNADTFAATGDVFVKGSLAATESGVDTFAATGSGVVTTQGTLSATESGSDTFAATGKVRVAGALAASETGADTLSATGKVLVRGALASSETGADTFAAAGTREIEGTLAVSETGSDTLSASGKVRVAGTLASSEAGSDAATATGQVIVNGALAATESGADTFSAAGTREIEGTLAASETGTDTFFASGAGQVAGNMAAAETGSDTAAAAGAVTWAPRTGTLAATEAADTFGGYVAPGYVEPGYVTGVDGTLGTTWALSGAQVLLLRQIWQLHGLGAPLTVAASTRSTADITQTIAQAGQAVTVSTTAASQTFSGNPGQMIEELAALHGITAPLTVTPTSRTAGTIVQSLATVGSVTTVTRQ